MTEAFQLVTLKAAKKNWLKKGGMGVLPSSGALPVVDSHIPGFTEPLMDK